MFWEDSPPKFGGWISTPQIWGVWVFRVRPQLFPEFLDKRTDSPREAPETLSSLRITDHKRGSNLLIGGGEGFQGLYERESGGAHRVQTYPKGWGRLEGMRPKALPPRKNSSQQRIWSSHFSRDLSQVAGRTPHAATVLFSTCTSLWPHSKLGNEKCARTFLH